MINRGLLYRVGYSVEQLQQLSQIFELINHGADTCLDPHLRHLSGNSPYTCSNDMAIRSSSLKEASSCATMANTIKSPTLDIMKKTCYVHSVPVRTQRTAYNMRYVT